MERNKYSWLGKICVNIGRGVDIKANGSFTCESNVVRIAAKEDSYITNLDESDDGVFIPSNHVEYFEVEAGSIIKVKSGEINISSIYK